MLWLKERGIKAELVGLLALCVEVPFIVYLAFSWADRPALWAVGLATAASVAFGLWRVSAAMRPLAQAVRALRAYARNGEVRPLPRGQEGIVGSLVESIAEVRRRSEVMTASLSRLANVDLLTNLPNRRAFMDFVATADLSRGYAVAIVDVDRFKQVNDTIGHDGGDKVLHVVAGYLREGMRSTDFVARLGGEEFVAIFPGATQEQAGRIIDRIRERLFRDAPFRIDAVPVSFSAGVSAANGNDAGVADVMKRADLCLYRAKASGRNRIEVALAA